MELNHALVTLCSDRGFAAAQTVEQWTCNLKINNYRLITPELVNLFVIGHSLQCCGFIYLICQIILAMRTFNFYKV